MNPDGLYNRALGLPQGAAQLFSGRFILDYSSHAKAASQNDRYGRFELLPAEDIKPEYVVEVQVEFGRAVKAVVRVPYDEEMDLVLVLNRPEGSRAFVKTAWLNSRRDRHSTLNVRNVRRPVAGLSDKVITK